MIQTQIFLSAVGCQTERVATNITWDTDPSAYVSTTDRVGLSYHLIS